MLILSMQHFTRSDLVMLCEKAGIFGDKDCTPDVSSPLRGKTMATIFLDSDPESRMAFSSAMIRLGGSVINIKDQELKPEDSFEDVIYQAAQYVDVLIAYDKNSEISFFEQQNGLITRMSDEDLYQNR